MREDQTSAGSSGGTLVKSLNAAYPSRPRSSSEYQRHELVRITAAGYGYPPISTTVGVETMPLKRLPTFDNYFYQEAGVRFLTPPKESTNVARQFQLPGKGDLLLGFLMGTCRLKFGKGDTCPCARCSPSSSGAVLGGDPAFLFGGVQ